MAGVDAHSRESCTAGRIYHAVHPWRLLHACLRVLGASSQVQLKSGLCRTSRPSRMKPLDAHEITLRVKIGSYVHMRFVLVMMAECECLQIHQSFLLLNLLQHAGMLHVHAQHANKLHVHARRHFACLVHLQSGFQGAGVCIQASMCLRTGST